MADSTLSITYDDLRAAIGNYLGIGMTTTDWSTTETAKVEMIIKSGLRQFYFPPPLQDDMGRMKVHKWTFLMPVQELTLTAPYSTGTIAIANGETTVTLTDGTWPSWAATNGTLIVGTAEYTISSRTNDTEIELAEAWSEDTETAATYSLKHDGNYDLPDNYGGIEGNLVIESANYKPEIVMVGEGKIRSMRQIYPQNSESGSYSTPYYAAVRPKVHSTTTAGQRFEIMFFPLPNDAYVVSYRMRILPEMLVDTTLEYPYGGAEHAETLRAACIAAAEEQENSNRLDGARTYDKKKLFEERLQASIAQDKVKNGVDFFGYNGDNSDERHRDDSTTRRARNTRLNYSLVTYTPSS